MTLTSQLIAARPVDDYRLFVYPVVLGHGHRLFADSAHVPHLRLEETRRFRSGIVLLRYEPNELRPTTAVADVLSNATRSTRRPPCSGNVAHSATLRFHLFEPVPREDT